jgi:branched-chain amino acid transport system substrate-binding protein
MSRKHRILLSIIAINVLFYIILVLASHFKKESIYIAFVGPMGQQYGQEAADAVDMYLEKINDTGGAHGRKIELLRFDDRNDKKIARQIAQEIADRDDVMLVLGHYSSSASIAAGEIYDIYGVPAITASATSDAVTIGKRWYFSAIPNNAMQADFITNYLFLALGGNAASLIFEDSAFGASLAADLEKAARELGIAITEKWVYGPDEPDLDMMIDTIVEKLAARDDPGTILFATEASSGARIIAALKDADIKCQIVGPDYFSEKVFLDSFKQLPGEQAHPGYYSDGIYCTTPFMANVAVESAYLFVRQFRQRYGNKPTWSAACYYDAVHLAVEAIKNAEIGLGGRTKRDRRNIRDALAGFYHEKNAVSGISGKLYFDRNGVVNRPYTMGVYKDQELLPAFTQYQQIDQKRVGESVFQNVLDGKYILVDNMLMDQFSVIYTDIELNRIRNLNIKKGVSTLDFHIWFRFSGDLNDADIEFTNTMNPLFLKDPVAEKTVNGVTTRLYHIEAEFRADLNLNRYPYDAHRVSIRFRHASKKDARLVAVEGLAEISGLKAPVAHKKSGQTIVPSGWRLAETYLFRNDLLEDPKIDIPRHFRDGQMTNLTQYVIKIRLDREGWGYLIKRFFPLVIMLAILYAICFIPAGKLVLRLLVSATALCLIALYHLYELASTPVQYTTPVEYGLYALYLITAATIYLSIRVYSHHRQGHDQKCNRLIRTGKLICPCFAFVIVSLMAVIR